MNDMCSVTNSAGEGCKNRTRGRSICATHGYRLRRYGDVQADRPIRQYNLTKPREGVRYQGATEEDRFWARVTKTAGCWFWSGSVMNSGYGQAIYGGFSKCAHRIAWELTRGERPDGQRIIQTCQNKLCVKPNHLMKVAEIKEEAA